LIKLDNTTVTVPTPVVIVAAALSGPSPPNPEAVNDIEIACAADVSSRTKPIANPAVRRRFPCNCVMTPAATKVLEDVTSALLSITLLERASSPSPQGPRTFGDFFSYS